MNGGLLLSTIIVGAVVVIIVCLIIRKMIKDKKSGKSLTCSGDCSQCHRKCKKI